MQDQLKISRLNSYIYNMFINVKSRIHILFHFTFLFLVLMLLLQESQSASSTASSDVTQSLILMPNLTIQLIYSPSLYYNMTNLQLTSVFNKGEVNQQFLMQIQEFSCTNLGLFILNQSSFNQEYFLIIKNYTKDILVEITSLYGDTGSPKTNNYTCQDTNTSLCNITLKTFCSQSYSFNIVSTTIYTSDKQQQVTQFFYNIVCNEQLYQHYFQIQWGTAIIAVSSIFMILVSSKFQQLQSYNNIHLDVNYYLIGLYCILELANFLLFSYQVSNFQNVLNFILIGFSCLFGVLATMICFSEFVYCLGIQFFRTSLCMFPIKVRVMDLTGFAIGLAWCLGWFFSKSNWVISDFIFVFIYTAVIKILKFSSLKIALIFFLSTLVIDLSFSNIIQRINSTYTNSVFYAFNNPLFILLPLVAKIPNRRCAWHFLPSIAYPGMFLAYLQRFDINRSSKIYGPIFVLCYGICSFLWFVVDYFVPIALPYDLFTVPIAMVSLLLFANRRGQLTDLWLGTFYDQQKQYRKNQKSILEKLQMQKSVSFRSNMLKNLKYDDDNSDYQSSKGSKFSQVIKSTNLRPLQQNKHLSLQAYKIQKKDSNKQNQDAKKKGKERDMLSSGNNRILSVNGDQIQLQQAKSVEQQNTKKSMITDQ